MKAPDTDNNTPGTGFPGYESHSRPAGCYTLASFRNNIHCCPITSKHLLNCCHYTQLNESNLNYSALSTMVAP